jgi:putative serine protease PepD
VPDDDVAVIRIDSATGLRPIEMGRSDLARVGDDVVAIGNALALAGSPTVTRGIVSATERSIDDKANNIHLDHLLQTDAAINPGNSGGALLNAAGQLIGINVAVAGQAQNIGFALSVDSIKVVINDIKAASR